MPQINSGKSPPWVSGEIVTAAGLNGMIDSATITPSVITDQTNFSTLTGDEHSLIVDPVSGLLKKTQVKNFLNHGSPVVTNSITNVVSGDNIVIESNGSSGDIQLIAGSGGYLGTISATATTININAVNGTSGTVSLTAGDTISLSTTSSGKVEIGPNVEFVSTSAVKLPVGTTAQRPATPVAGDTRFNSTTSKLEFYNGTEWTNCVTSNATTSFNLYEIYEETIPEYSITGNTIPLFTSTSITKPTNEVWIFEVVGSMNFGGNELLNFKLDGVIKWNSWFGSGYSPFSIRWTEGVGSTYTSKTITIDMSGVGVSATISPSNIYFPASSGKLRIYKHKTV